MGKINSSLVILFVLYFCARLYFTLQTEYFGDDHSYYVLRQVENIQETGRPIVEDSLSYGGRTFVILPFYYYLLALLSLPFKTVISLKIINNLLASLLIIAVYVLCTQIVKNKRIALICSIVAASMPIYINLTLNNINPNSILYPGGLFLIFLFITLDLNRLNYIIPLSIILLLTAPSALIIALGLIFYVVLNYIENRNTEKIELEFVFFLLLFIVWAYLILFKNAFMIHGFNSIWANTPKELMSNYFGDIDLITIIANIGILPITFGTFITYIYLFVKKSKSINLIISIYVISSILLWLKLVPIDVGLSFLGISLVVLFGQFLKDGYIDFKKSKFSHHINLVLVLVFLLLFIIQILPGFGLMKESIGNSYSSNYIEGYKWINTLPKNSTILGLPEEGNLITYFGDRKNVIDTEYLLIKDANLRHEDTTNFYNLRFLTGVERTLSKYNAEYFIVSDNLKQYNISQVFFLGEECIKQVYNGTIRVYKSECDST